MTPPEDDAPHFPPPGIHPVETPYRTAAPAPPASVRAKTVVTRPAPPPIEPLRPEAEVRRELARADFEGPNGMPVREKKPTESTMAAGLMSFWRSADSTVRLWRVVVVVVLVAMKLAAALWRAHGR